MGGLSVELLLAVACAITFFRAGAFESVGAARDHGFFWALLSVGLSALVLLALHGSWVALLLAQIGLFVGIGVYRALRDT